MSRKQRSPKNFILLGAVVFFVSVAGVAYTLPNQTRLAFSTMQDAGVQLASVVLSHNFKSIAEIKSHYTLASSASSHAKVRILLVPGHEPDFGGAEFNTLKERDLTLALAQDLQQLLANNPHYQVFITRDAQGWTPSFAAYYKDNWDSIVQWAAASRDEFSRLVAIGSTTQTYSTVFHNSAPQDVALRLYGVTKWSDENNMDIVIHIHMNDNVRTNVHQPGKYSGFAIYVPAAQYGNSTTTKTIAGGIFKRLAKYNPVSDLPGESSGIVNEPELIAIGANNTADAASMLIEYSYIYEPQLQDPQVRALALNDLAFQTYLGLQDFFDPNGTAGVARSYDTLILPHVWKSPLVGSTVAASDVFALQTALMFDGVYPPGNKSKNDCPRTGVLGPCTRASVTAFQNENGISDGAGVIGPKTLRILNRI